VTNSGGANGSTGRASAHLDLSDDTRRLSHQPLSTQWSPVSHIPVSHL